MSKNFKYDFRDIYPYICTPLDQTQCNSCWSITSVTTLQDTIMIKNGYNELNNVNNISYQVFSSEILKTDDGCKRIYSLKKALLELLDVGGYCPQTKRRYYPKDAYKLSANTMIDELKKGKPLACLIEIYKGNKNLLQYVKGEIYGYPWWIQGDIPEMDGYHSIVIIGYGEENGIKYWIVRNSWGKEFGDNGYFKILRAHNCCGIEEDVFCLDV